MRREVCGSGLDTEQRTPQLSGPLLIGGDGGGWSRNVSLDTSGLMESLDIGAAFPYRAE